MEKVISRSSFYLSIFLFILLENILLYSRLNPLSQILAIPFLLFLPGLLIILTLKMENIVIFKPINTIKEKFRFIIIGTGGYLKKCMTKYRNDKRFIFVQGVPHNKALYYILNSDICIGSYDPKYPLFEKYGYYLCSLKLLEYAAASKPSIIYSLPNTFLKKFENANACLVVNSRKDFINKLVNLMQNKELREIMGINAKKMAIKYSWENAAKKTEEILKQRNLKM